MKLSSGDHSIEEIASLKTNLSLTESFSVSNIYI